MRFTITVEIEVERIEGKFASRDDIGGQLVDAINDANPGSLTSENDAGYEVTSWDATEVPETPRKRR
jgi:hypothetical protein